MSYDRNPVIIHAHVGRGGHSLVWCVEGTRLAGSTTHGYLTSAGDVLDEVRGRVLYPGTDSEKAFTVSEGAVLIDSTTVAEDDIATYAVRGPMVDVTLPPGTRQFLGAPRPWANIDGAPFGDASGMDHVARDVAVILAHRHGATVYDLSTGERIDPAPAPVQLDLLA